MKNIPLGRTAGAALILAAFVFPFNAGAQTPFKAFDNMFTTPKSYVVKHADKPPVIDGDINDEIWSKADWSAAFEDIEGDLKPHPALQTNVKMLWDDSCLYIAAKLNDPNVWAYLTRHDEIVYHDNDFEIFIDPANTTHQYFEIEVNAVNTIFDLFLNKPYRDNGIALTSWDTQGLRSGVKVLGTLNDPNDVDKGWTVEMAIPFKSLTSAFGKATPKDNSVWRINFSRVEWDTKVVNGKYVKLTDSVGHSLPEHNWVWSPQGIIAMHAPERWGYLKFSRDNDSKPFEIPYAELQKRYLWLVYYNEKKWYAVNHVYSKSLGKFDIKKKTVINNSPNEINIEATDHQFMAFISDDKGQKWSINQDGLISRLNKKSEE